MSIDELLSQDEIDALLHGVSNDEIDTQDHAATYEGDVALYDFANQERVVRGRMPSLEMVNERYARQFRNSLFKLLRRGTEVTVSSVQMLKYSEYVYSLVIPTSLTVVKIQPLRGNILLVMDPKLVFTVVDNFFGGNGRLEAKIEGRDFAPTELRLIQRMMDMSFVDIQQAWKPVMDIKPEYVSTEVNPQFANIVGPNEVVVVTTFMVEVEGVGGEFHIAIPYTSLEPIRDRLDTVLHNESNDSDERWSNALRDELEHSNVTLSCRFAHTELSLRDVMELKAGDVIPIDVSKPATLCSEGIPLLKGRLGKIQGKNSVAITGQVQFPPRQLRSVSKEAIDER